MKHILLFLTLATGVVLNQYSWVGATGGNWNTAANWSPATVPNGATDVANINNVSGGSGTINVDTMVTLNQLNLTSASTNWSIAPTSTNKITFDGTDAQFNATRSSTFTCPVILNVDLALNMNSNQTINLASIWTNGAHDIHLTSTSGGSVFLNAVNTGTGTYYYSGNGINLFNNSGFGSMTVNWTNAGSVTSSIVKQSPATGMANNVVINDTGTQSYYLNGNTSMTATGTWSGDVKHDFLINGVNFTSANLSGLTFSGAGRLVFKTDASTLTSANALNGSVEIALGDAAVAGSTLTYSSTAITNPISIRPFAGSTGTYRLVTSASATLSGNMSLNPNAATTGTHTFQLACTGTCTYSGVTSNGASGAATTTFVHNSTGILNVTNTSSYTSPTLVNAAGRLNVTGSIASSTVTVSNGTLQGTGTVGPVVISTLNGKIEARDATSPSTSQVLTIGGNLTENAATLHTFHIGAANATSKLQVNGNVTLNGTVAVNSSQTGVYEIVNYTGTRSGTWSTAIAGATITYDDILKKIYLTIP